MDRGSTETYLTSGRVSQRLVQKYPFLSEAYDRSLDLFDVPCGTCLNCRLTYARTWSQRCLLESKCWDENWFVTLTYDDDHLRYGEVWPTLVPPDVVLFLKRLREYCRERGHIGVRFYMCGEYGDTTCRPHYHLLLFNLPINDLKYYSKSMLGDTYWNSETMTRLWSKGHVVVGEVTEQSAAYVARYVMKKANNNTDYDSLGVHKEYVRMSRNPGIGLFYLVHHLEEIYEKDQIYLPGGKIVKPCRYFDEKAMKLLPDADWDAIKARRQDVANVLANIKVNQVSAEYYGYLDDLEKELEKSSKALTRPL